ncbi:MAG: hypothetical protein IPJ88_17510 [Myxococcales bacterium]|nr:MAG: hypothetical protein IPJ88_17510 [Myxococcales bacterium]
MMDSSVRVHVNDRIGMSFIVRAQRSDFPQSTAEELFSKVRNAAGPTAGARGYAEAAHDVTDIKDPVNSDKVLDVWHEVRYSKQNVELPELAEEVRWAMQMEKFISKV